MKKTLFYILIISLFLSNTFLFSQEKLKNKNNNSFALVNASVKNGEENVKINKIIRLEFSKNVNNITVVENNIKQIDIVTKDGKSVLKEVLSFDDQLDRKNRDFLDVVGNFENNKEYILIIGKEIMSKRGDTLKEPIKIKFRTTKKQP